MKNKKLMLVAGVIVLGAVCFYGGYEYGSANVSAARSGADFIGRNGSINGFGSGGGMGGRMMAGQRGGFVGGEILSMDDKSITLKLQDGGSRIVFLSSSTPVTKSVSGSVSDLTVGGQVTVSGSPNSDGSITAQSVQVRPATPLRPGQ